jgi:hypothetical protein
MDYLLLIRGWYSDLQAPTSDRLDDFAQALAVGDDSTERHVSLHGPSQSRLSLLGKVVKLVDDDHFEGLLLFLI